MLVPELLRCGRIDVSEVPGKSDRQVFRIRYQCRPLVGPASRELGLAPVVRVSNRGIHFAAQALNRREMMFDFVPQSRKLGKIIGLRRSQRGAKGIIGSAPAFLQPGLEASDGRGVLRVQHGQDDIAFEGKPLGRVEQTGVEGGGAGKGTNTRESLPIGNHIATGDRYNQQGQRTRDKQQDISDRGLGRAHAQSGDAWTRLASRSSRS
ncbi:MAG TPA: hypothetical protein VHV26_12265 [Rhizomicrobium sp.]|nr:hypothetical protein [Rhizomicrobium sp.]